MHSLGRAELLVDVVQIVVGRHDHHRHRHPPLHEDILRYLERQVVIVQRLIGPARAGNPASQTDDVRLRDHDGFNGVDDGRLVDEIEEVDVAVPHVLEVVVALGVRAFV